MTSNSILMKRHKETVYLYMISLFSDSRLVGVSSRFLYMWIAIYLPSDLKPLYIYLQDIRDNIKDKTCRF